MNEFDLKNRSAVMNLLTHRYSIPEYDADDILQDAWVLLLDKLTVGEMHDVPEKLSAYLTKVCSYKAHEYLRRKQFEVRNPSFDDDAFTPEELTAFEMEAQSWDDFLEGCRRAEHRRLDIMEKELDKLTPKEASLLMGYYETDGSKTSMRELARRMGYSSDRVAITLKSRLMKKLRTGIQQQEEALGNGLSPVAFLFSAQGQDFRFYHSLLVSIRLNTSMSETEANSSIQLCTLISSGPKICRTVFRLRNTSRVISTSLCLSTGCCM